MSGKFSKKNHRGADAPIRKKANPMEKVLLIVVLLVMILLAVFLVGMIWTLASSAAQPPAPTGTKPPVITDGPTDPTPPPASDPLESDPTTPSKPAEPSKPTESERDFLPLDLGDGLRITDIGPYTGSFMEDGSDKVVADVLMVILENTSDKALQYARLTLDYGDVQAKFSITNIPAGQRVVLLESGRMEYRKEEPMSATVDDALFVEAFDLYEDVFEITGTRGNITVRNISGEAVSGDIYVYYKNTSKDLLYGGITYRARLEGGLAPGESKQILAGHYNPSGSVILMITYTP